MVRIISSLGVASNRKQEKHDRLVAAVETLQKGRPEELKEDLKAIQRNIEIHFPGLPVEVKAE